MRIIRSVHLLQVVEHTEAAEPGLSFAVAVGEGAGGLAQVGEHLWVVSADSLDESWGVGQF